MTNNSASINWINGLPFSSKFEDIYFSLPDGIEEKKHVFLIRNQLDIRFKASELDFFTIVETGFGTGLSFLLTWALWREVAPKKARLHFISTEKFPLRPEDLKNIVHLWPSLRILSDELLKQYQNIINGWHRFDFPSDNVSLTLLVGDVEQTLPKLKATVDAWFLDGFSPSKNPEMWKEDLYETMAKLSTNGTTFSTYTSAGKVKRGLEAVGFKIEKVKGYGNKKDMLCGRFSKEASSDHTYPKHVIVIGAGIAGSATSYALARRGCKVTLIERHSRIACEASGNPIGIIYPRLSTGEAILNKLALSGYLYTIRLLKKIDLKFNCCGVLQLAFNGREATRIKSVADQGLPETLVKPVNSQEASDIANIQLHHEGLFFSEAGFINPPELCKKLIEDPNISTKLHTQAIELKYVDNLWEVWEEGNLISKATTVVICNANEALRFKQTEHTELIPARGQITLFPENSITKKLKTVLCTDSYLTPSHDQIHCIGATFYPNNKSTEIEEMDNSENLKSLENISLEFKTDMDLSDVKGRASLRCTTADYLPSVGPLLDVDIMRAEPPRYNTNPTRLPWIQGLFINTGHGSKGLTNAPICGEVIASAIFGEPQIIDSKILAAIDPNRFLLRRMGLKKLIQGLAIFPEY